MSQPGLAGINGPALIPAVVVQSGEHTHTTENGTIWEYRCEIDRRATNDERRSCSLRASGLRLDGARPGDLITTPWGAMQRMPGTGRDRGWLLQGTGAGSVAIEGGDAPVITPATTAEGRLSVPGEALSRGGVWSSVIGSWRYRVRASQLGTASEQRTGWLAHGNNPVYGSAAGDAVDTPWGALVWTGTIAPGRIGAPEQGWLLSGAQDRPLAAGPTARLGLDALPQLRVESLYLAAAVSLSWDGPIGHGVSLAVTGWLGDETASGRLTFDPNACALNELGDREACTKIALHSCDVMLTRMRSPDPACLGRRLYAVTGAGLPAKLVLIVYPHGERVYLKHESTIVPLFLDDGVA